jgi:hypothetical protein
MRLRSGHDHLTYTMEAPPRFRIDLFGRTVIHLEMNRTEGQMKKLVVCISVPLPDALRDGQPQHLNIRQAAISVSRGGPPGNMAARGMTPMTREIRRKNRSIVTYCVSGRDNSKAVIPSNPPCSMRQYEK